MVYKNVSDLVLWQYCRKDDMRAYNELFRRYYHRLLTLAARYIKDEMMAEELCMDQLYLMWNRRHVLTIHSDFSNYLFRSMRNLVITRLRKNIPVMAELDALIEERQSGRAADYDMLSEEAELAYQNALNELSPQRRKVFMLSREENLSYSEIARELNLSVNTVENYMVSALDSLRKNINAYVPTTLLPLFFFFSNCLPLLLS